jgi:hypothetical protein
MTTLTLLTPAVMVDGKTAEGDFFARCADYFDTQLGGAKLENMFASRYLGGGYLGHRYRPYGKTYYPFVLTTPGSVFRLRLPNEAARSAVSAALRYGLPAATLDGRKAHWSTCPFVPENGYGAVSSTLHRVDDQLNGGLEPEKVVAADVF